MANKEQVIQALRATLISVKGALTLKQCNRDYRELQGEWIPFKKLGYPTLEKLFLDDPGFKVEQINGEWYVDAIASQETQHIVSMVARQKSSKKPSAKVNFNSKQYNSWRKPNSQGNTTNYSNQYQKQYYRVKGGLVGGHNYQPAKNIKNLYNKANDSKINNANSKQTKTSSEHSEAGQQPVPKTKTNCTIQQKDNNIPHKDTSKVKTIASNRAETENGIKVSGKISASQRLSNLRDRLNTAALIPLQFPAATKECLEISGPVTQVMPALNLEPPPESTSPIEKLEWTCYKLGLPQPNYKVQQQAPKRGPVIYYCSVLVGTKYKELSYPDPSSTEEEAKKMAAVKLLTRIESSEAEGLPISSPQKILPNLTKLISEHECGLWASIIPHHYREKYGENLPNDWQELVKNCPQIVKDKLVNDTILLINNSQDTYSPLQETLILDETIDSELPPLQFPEENLWNVFITVANSTLEIWFRIIGPEYTDIYEPISVEMNEYYSKNGTEVKGSMLVKNAWYVVNLEDCGWHRAKILDIQESTATVFLGDHGDDEVVTFDKIKVLEPRFKTIPPQAILCRLVGAEELAASRSCGDLVRRLVGETLVAVPGPRDDPTDPAVSVVLYDTSTPRDINLNNEIVHDFCIAGTFTITQELTEVQVGCVTDEGRVWVSSGAGSALVRAALQLLTTPGPYRRPLPASPPAPPPHHAHQPHPLYIVRTLDGDWVRCKIISGLDGEGTVRTQLIDSGMILRAPLSSLVPLQVFSPALNAFPPQAIQVRLGSVERIASQMTSWLRDLLLDARVLCRGVPVTSPGAPLVELFVRTGPQNMLVSVNTSVKLEYDCQQQDKPKIENEESVDPVEALNRRKERIFRSTSSGNTPSEEKVFTGCGVLPAPALPSPSKCFDVYIAMAASPWNFVVQPNATRPTLSKMMAMLQMECPKLPDTDIPEKPAKGELYTALYEKDSTWYRVLIAAAVSPDTVSVYFCDFGDMALLASRALRQVPAAVPLAKSLPPQAIKARLYDVRPLHQDWAVEDCIRFQELCVEQQFVGVCKEVGRDPLNPSEPLLTLDLIDTTTDDDVYLNKLLVTEGRAKLSSASQ